MGSMSSQCFAEFRNKLPIKCQCGGIFVNMNKLSKKYIQKLSYICSDCGQAIWIGDYEEDGT